MSRTPLLAWVIAGLLLACVHVMRRNSLLMDELNASARHDARHDATPRRAAVPGSPAPRAREDPGDNREAALRTAAWLLSGDAPAGAGQALTHDSAAYGYRSEGRSAYVCVEDSCVYMSVTDHSRSAAAGA